MCVSDDTCHAENERGLYARASSYKIYIQLHKKFHWSRDDIFLDSRRTRNCASPTIPRDRERGRKEEKSERERASERNAETALYRFILRAP